MRVFAFAFAAAFGLAVIAWPILNSIQETSAQAYHTGAARLDSQERVNNYGREG